MENRREMPPVRGITTARLADGLPCLAAAGTAASVTRVEPFWPACRRPLNGLIFDRSETERRNQRGMLSIVTQTGMETWTVLPVARSRPVTGSTRKTTTLSLLWFAASR